MTRYEKAIYSLFMQERVWCKLYWPEGHDGEVAATYYICGIAAMSGKMPNQVGGDYYRFLMEVDESLVDEQTAEILKDRPCVVSPGLVLEARRELAGRAM